MFSKTSSGTPNYQTTSLTFGGNGDAEFTTTYARYAVVGKLLYFQFKIVQSSADTTSSTDDFTVAAPSGVTLVNRDNAGSALTNDIGNDGQYLAQGVESVASGNVFKFPRSSTNLYIRGGNWVGNNGVARLSVSIVTEIA